MTKTRKCYANKGQSAVIARNEAIQRPVYFRITSYLIMTKTRKCVANKGLSAVIARNEAIQRPVYYWIASCLAMTASADDKRSGFISSFFLFA
ncbi:MAG: hypothetical protein LBT42_06430 [Tannerella sp.]|nr:hypothetical protein [Tannerella sp.]